MQIFYALTLFSLTFATSLTHAQIYKCTRSTGVVFQQAPCDGGVRLQERTGVNTSIETKKSKTEPPPTATTAAPKPEGSFASPVQSQGSNTVCPTNFDIRNAETSASSVTDPVATNIAKKALVVAMKKCPKKLICADILAIAPNTRIAYDAAQLYGQLSEVTKQAYLQLDRDRDTKLCEAYKY